MAALIDDEQRLNLANRGLTDLACLAQPDVAAEDIVDLDASNNRIKTLPAATRRLVSVERVCMHHNVLQALPDMSPLGCLTHLNISRNQLTALDASVFKLELVELLAGNNLITALPDVPRTNTSLKLLDVSNNRLSCLPNSIVNFRKLAILFASRNALTALPDDVGELASLVTLDVSANKIQELPTSLCRLNHLEELSVQDNPLLTPPAELCARGRIHIFNFLANHQRAQAAEPAAAAAGAAAAGTGAAGEGDQQQQLTGVMGMLTDVVTSIYTPGVNRGLEHFVYLIYFVLVLFLLILLVTFGPNIHVVVLTVLSVGLALSLHWFITELGKAQASQAAAGAEGGDSSEASSSTEKKKDK